MNSKPDQMVYMPTNAPFKFKNSRPKVPPSIQTSQQPLLATCISWYTEFLGTRLLVGNVHYSALRDTFVSKAGVGIPAEYFLDLNELQALCEFIGPAGFKLFDEKLVRMLTTLASATKVRNI
jgi:hypothetical protein